MGSDYFSNVKANYGKREAEKFKRPLPNWSSPKVTLYKLSTEPSASWYFKFRIKGERQYFKRSLRTSNFTEACEQASEQLVEIRAAQQNGAAIVSPTLDETIRLYKLVLEAEVTQNQRRKSTYVRIARYLETLKIFLREKIPSKSPLKMASIDGEIFNQYRDWRITDGVKERYKAPSNLPISQELIHFKAFITWAIKKRYANQRSEPVYDSFPLSTHQRERLTEKDYRRTVALLRGWANKKIESAKESYERQLIYHSFLVMANTGMRTGEVLNLKNSDLEIDAEKNAVRIFIRKEATKVNTRRGIILRASSFDDERAEENLLIRWIKKFQIHKHQNDFVFHNFNQSTYHTSKVFYRYWSLLRKEVLEPKGLGYMTAYHARHAFVTFSIRNGANVYSIAKMLGTSLSQIQATYDHILSEQASDDVFLKRSESRRKV